MGRRDRGKALKFYGQAKGRKWHTEQPIPKGTLIVCQRCGMKKLASMPKGVALHVCDDCMKEKK